jgi:diacylglycerol kinase family enzyme
VVTVIVNPISGGSRGRDLAQRVELARTVVTSFNESVTVAVSEHRGHVRELAAAAVSSGSRLVIVWGGDGTVNEAGTALMGTGTPLAMVPSGSGNGLARELGVPPDPAAAIARALTTPPRTIDAGELGGRPFFNLAGLGFDAHVASRFDRAASRGLSTYVRVSAREFMTYRSATYRIDPGAAADSARAASSGDSGDRSARGETPPRRALLVVFANSPQFGNGARIAPSARLDDGRLDLVVYEEVSRFSTLRVLPRLFIGGIEKVRGLSIQQIERARVESDAPITFHVDGEPVEGGRVIEARVLPGAIQVCAA